MAELGAAGLGLGRGCTIGTTNGTGYGPVSGAPRPACGWVGRVRSNSDDFVFRRGVFATLRGTFLVDLHLLLLLNRFVVGRGSRDVETAEPVVSCDA